MDVKHDFKRGDMVQMTRLGIKRSLKNVYYPKTEDSRGLFVRYDGGTFREGKHPAAIIDWYTGEHFPVFRRQSTRLDYLEPHGTPR